MIDWEPNKAEIAAACDLMGVRWPVRVTRTSSRQHSGRWCWKWRHGDPTPVHMICVERWTTSDNANQILWHELAHAKQAEESAGDLTDKAEIIAAIRKDVKREHLYHYSIRPCEIEATTYEQASPYWKLVRSISEDIDDLVF